MCGGGSSGPGPAQLAMEQEQLRVQKETSDAQLAEQRREFDIQQKQSDQTLQNLKDQQARQQAEADNQANLTKVWEKGRQDEIASGTDSINKAFASFTPDYYKKYQSDYIAHYQPQVEQQYGAASNDTVFGLARTGNLQSQTAADQFQNLQTQKGTALADINNQAVAKSADLQSSVLGAKQNLMSQVTSDATLGSPITPGSVDSIAANFNSTSAALGRISNSAGDTVTTLQATPQYSSLGTLFGSAASLASNAAAGNTAYGNMQAFNSAFGAANPTGGSGSSRVSG